MNVFFLRDQLVRGYSEYVRSFIQIRDERIRDHVAQRLAEGNGTVVVLADVSAVPKSVEVEFDAGLALGVVNSMAMPELEALPEMVTDDELEEFCKVG